MRATVAAGASLAMIAIGCGGGAGKVVAQSRPPQTAAARGLQIVLTVER